MMSFPMLKPRYSEGSLWLRSDLHGEQQDGEKNAKGYQQANSNRHGPGAINGAINPCLAVIQL